MSEVEYTPTTDEIRKATKPGSYESWGPGTAYFDRWLAAHDAEVAARALGGAEPGRWWRSVAPDGSLWGESSDGTEIREMARPGDRIERMWIYPERAEWREVTA